MVPRCLEITAICEPKGSFGGPGETLLIFRVLGKLHLADQWLRDDVTFHASSHGMNVQTHPLLCCCTILNAICLISLELASERTGLGT